MNYGTLCITAGDEAEIFVYRRFDEKFYEKILEKEYPESYTIGVVWQK